MLKWTRGQQSRKLLDIIRDQFSEMWWNWVKLTRDRSRRDALNIFTSFDDYFALSQDAELQRQTGNFPKPGSDGCDHLTTVQHHRCRETKAQFTLSSTSSEVDQLSWAMRVYMVNIATTRNMKPRKFNDPFQIPVPNKCGIATKVTATHWRPIIVPPDHHRKS